jgi:hypothetical protein
MFSLDDDAGPSVETIRVFFTISPFLLVIESKNKGFDG